MGTQSEHCLVLDGATDLLHDVFEQARSHHASVEGIYMSFTNAPTTEHHTANSRILLCEVPTGCNVFEAIHIIIIEQMQLLEQGINGWSAKGMSLYASCLTWHAKRVLVLAF
jgi:hypothetical protein